MKPIRDYENLYSITEDGIVYSHINKKYLKPVKQHTGYATANLYKNGKMKVYTIHRLVANAFLDKPQNLNTVNHKDFNKLNNHVSNLEWCTNQYNIKHSRSTGICSGEKNPNSKLKETEVLEIRSKYKNGNYTYAMLSNEYGVGKVYIGRIINNKVWNLI
jgi:hypothetical protein